MTKTFSNMSAAQVERLAKKNREKSKNAELEQKREPKVRVNLAESSCQSSSTFDSMFKEMKKRPYA